MADQAQLSLLQQGARVWNEWKVERPIAADLKGADLAGKDLSGADLRGADLEGANLRGAKLAKADLHQADLSGADLQDVGFDGTDLFEAKLREANLQGADLSGAEGGLRTEQLAGANLTGTKLPEQLSKLYDGLENVKGISESARKLFLAVLGACLYSWLTIATTTDVNLITDRNSSPLPIIQTPIPIVGFYVVAPLLVLCVYSYFHFYLQKLWEELGCLPAVFPDGRPLHAKVDPWLLNDLVRSHLRKLNVNRPFLSYLQLWISVLLAWWVVPLTMLLFWGRCLMRHDWIVTTFHLISLVVSLVAAFCLYRLAVATLRGTERRPFAWKKALTGRRGYQTAVFAVATGVFFGLVSLGVLQGVRSKKPILGFKRRSEEVFRCTEGPRTWVPRAMALIRLPRPFADLVRAEVSEKKSTWSGKKGKDSDSVIGAQLRTADLRYASADNAFLENADLSYADLSGADLSEADLSNAELGDSHLNRAELWKADLSGARLGGADLSDADLSNAELKDSHLSRAILCKADLSGADLKGADLKGTDLRDSDLSYTDFRLAKNLDPVAVKRAYAWDNAFYDDEMLKALGLPLDHNNELISERGKEASVETD